MPDLTGLPVLDVLIGMAFLFFLLATVLASINEVIQTMLNARARILTRGIEALLEDKDAAAAFFKERRIKRLAKPPGVVRKRAQRLPFVAERRRPSYIPARTFALTLFESPTLDGPPTIGTGFIAEAQRTIRKIGVSSAGTVATEELTEAQAFLNATRGEIERTFDEVMDRASGWYKRYVQWWLLALALAVAIGLNVNTFTVAERLWTDDTLRAAIVLQARQAVGGPEQETPKSATSTTRANQIDKIEELKLPLGWDHSNTRGNFWGRLAGWLVSAAAITLGAPFWFDLLGKLAQLRGTGNREGTEKDSTRAPEDRDDPSRRRSAVG